VTGKGEDLLTQMWTVGCYLWGRGQWHSQTLYYPM